MALEEKGMALGKRAWRGAMLKGAGGNTNYPFEKSQYPINKKISGYYPIHQNFFSGALSQTTLRTFMQFFEKN